MIRLVLAFISLAINAGISAAVEWQVDAPHECGGESRLHVESPAWKPANSGANDFVPRIAGGMHSLSADQPDIPFLVHLMPIPRNCAATIEILHVDRTETNIPPISPVPREELRENEEGQRWVERIPGQLGPMYDRDAFWPDQMLTISYAAQGTQRWARIVFYPLQYNPKQGILRWNQRVEARLKWTEP